MGLGCKPARVIIYEPRQLFRNIVKTHFEEEGCDVLCLSQSPHLLAEEVISLQTETALFAVGIAGLGSELLPALRVVNQLSIEKRPVVVWLPDGDAAISKLMVGLGVRNILCESKMYDELKSSSAVRFISPGFLQPHHYDFITPLSESELKTLLDLSKGMSVNTIAAFRHNSYKTVYTHRRNARQRLDMDRTEWLMMLTRIIQIRNSGV